MALLVKQLVTRSAVMYRRPPVATPRFLSINGGVRDSESAFESRNGSCHDDIRGGGKISDGNTAKSSYEAFMNRFRATRWLSQQYRRITDLDEAFMNRFRATRWLSRHYRWINEDLSTMWMVPARLKEDGECLKVDIFISTDGPESVNISVDHNTVFVEARSSERKENFICWFDLPDIDSTVKMYKASDIKAVLRVQLGWLQLIIPKLKKEEMKYTPDIKTIIKGR